MPPASAVSTDDVVARLMTFDRDRDGKVTSVELSERMHSLITQGDQSGDGALDLSEVRAVKTVFGDHAYKLAMSSTKSAIGHLLGAAGAVEAVATLQALRGKTAPPTLNYEQPDEGLDLDYVTEGTKPLDVNGHPAIGISNSFGFGGHNAVLVVEAAP